MKTKLVLVPLVAIIAVIGLIAFSNRSQESQKITLGFVGPLSGPAALWGEGARNMAKLAVQEINASGGVNGKQLEINYQDGKCASPDAVSALQNLKASGVKLIIGGFCSPETVAMAPLTKDGSAFMLAGITSADGAVSVSDYAYRTSPDTADVTTKLVPYVATRYKKIATITELAPYPKSFTGDFEATAKKAGLTIVAHEEFAPGTTDFRIAITRLAAAGADAIVVSPQSPVAGAEIAKQMQERGMKTPLIGNAVFLAPNVFEKAGKPSVMHGVFTILPFTDPTDSKARVLQESYKKQFNTGVPYNLYYVGTSYDSVYMMVNAIKKCGEKTSCVADTFKNMEYAGAVSSYKFKESGDMQGFTWSVARMGADGSITSEVLK